MLKNRPSSAHLSAYNVLMTDGFTVWIFYSLIQRCRLLYYDPKRLWVGRGQMRSAYVMTWSDDVLNKCRPDVDQNVNRWRSVQWGRHRDRCM